LELWQFGVAPGNYEKSQPSLKNSSKNWTSLSEIKSKSSNDNSNNFDKISNSNTF
jgi:hypothetical protein